MQDTTHVQYVMYQSISVMKWLAERQIFSAIFTHVMYIEDYTQVI